jgi:AraC family transcriptional regulator
VWGQSFSSAPSFTTRAGDMAIGLLRRWRDSSPVMEQPALDHHYFVLHLGGPKRVTRRAGKCGTITEVGVGSVTIVPAGTAASWFTEGSIDFAHLYLAPAAMNQVIGQEFDRDARAVSLLDQVGIRDGLLEALFTTLLDEASAPGVGNRLYRDTLVHGFVLRLLRGHSTLPAVQNLALHALAPYRLRNVLALIEDRSAADISLADLAQAAGCSPYHFSRAFARATGKSPYAYLLAHRLDCAKVMLREGAEPVADIAHRSGFHSHAQFARMFKRATGLTPGAYPYDN